MDSEINNHKAVQRYLCSGYDGYMQGFVHGDYVRYEDYARLKEKTEGYLHTSYSIGMLQGKLSQKHQDYLALQKQNEANVLLIKNLKAEVERLNELILLGASIPDARPIE